MDAHAGLRFCCLETSKDRVSRDEAHFVFAYKIDFIFTNSADPDKMSHFAAFNLGLHICQSTNLGFSS